MSEATWKRGSGRGKNECEIKIVDPVKSLFSAIIKQAIVDYISLKNKKQINPNPKSGDQWITEQDRKYQMRIISRFLFSRQSSAYFILAGLNPSSSRNKLLKVSEMTDEQRKKYRGQKFERVNGKSKRKSTSDDWLGI